MIRPVVAAAIDKCIREHRDLLRALALPRSPLLCPRCNLGEVLRDELGKWCSRHYDEPACTWTEVP